MMGSSTVSLSFYLSLSGRGKGREGSWSFWLGEDGREVTGSSRCKAASARGIHVQDWHLWGSKFPRSPPGHLSFSFFTVSQSSTPVEWRADYKYVPYIVHTFCVMTTKSISLTVACMLRKNVLLHLARYAWVINSSVCLETFGFCSSWYHILLSWHMSITTHCRSWSHAFGVSKQYRYNNIWLGWVGTQFAIWIVLHLIPAVHPTFLVSHAWC